MKNHSSYVVLTSSGDSNEVATVAIQSQFSNLCNPGGNPYKITIVNPVATTVEIPLANYRLQLDLVLKQG